MVSAEQNVLSLRLNFPRVCGQVAPSHCLAAGPDFWSVICLMSALAAEDTNLWSADHIVFSYCSICCREEQHLFSVAGSHENSVSELVLFPCTLLVPSPPATSRLVPQRGNVNRYFRGVDVRIIWLAASMPHWERIAVTFLYVKTSLWKIKPGAKKKIRKVALRKGFEIGGPFKMTLF